jgi:hypothetical protein
LGQVEYAVGELAEVGPGGADGVHVDVAPEHAPTRTVASVRMRCRSRSRSAAAPAVTTAAREPAGSHAQPSAGSSRRTLGGSGRKELESSRRSLRSPPSSAMASSEGGRSPTPPRIDSPERSISAARTAIATSAALATASRTAAASAPVRWPTRRGVGGRPPSRPRQGPGASSSAKPQRAQRPAPARTSALQRGQLGVARPAPPRAHPIPWRVSCPSVGSLSQSARAAATRASPEPRASRPKAVALRGRGMVLAFVLKAAVVGKPAALPRDFVSAGARDQGR